MQLIKTYPLHLTPYIKYFYTVKGNSCEIQNKIHRHLPDGTLELIINLGSTVKHSPDGITWTIRPETVILGLFQEKSFVKYAGKVHLVGAVFQPGCAGLFLNDSLEHYKKSLLPAEFVFGNSVKEIAEQLHAAKTEQEKHYMLEKYFLNKINNTSGDYHISKMMHCVRFIHAMKGNLKMPVLSEMAYMSERNFRRKFGELVGMNPKQYANIIRIKSFVKQHKINGQPFADMIYDFGYTDQSHFVNDFKSIAGIAPSAFFAQLNTIDNQFIHSPS